jgi:hypothetical protein
MFLLSNPVTERLDMLPQPCNKFLRVYLIGPTNPYDQGTVPVIGLGTTRGSRDCLDLAKPSRSQSTHTVEDCKLP